MHQHNQIENRSLRNGKQPCRPCSRVYLFMIPFALILFGATIGAVLTAVIQIPTRTSRTATTVTTTTATAATTVTTTTSTSTSTTSKTTSSTSSSTSTTTSSTSRSTNFPIIYTQNFTFGVTSSSQCTAWNIFRSLLINHPCTSLTISGTNNPTGITLTNSTYATAIANAMRTNTAYGPVSSNGYLWAVGICGSADELTATGSVCTCTTGYTLRPCVGNSNWGGINGATCSASSQTMTVIFH
ncbi:unnamed protein product [Rotaria sordida]|uniref:Uncharacterized protein n=1 Tax=Rotaria sordida TaxID=392033 RepID=A0A818VJY1_9BILA|nr:unnamed protein product [Rotaria sordida]